MGMKTQKSQKSKTKIKNQRQRKTNSIVVETISLALKNPAWHKVAAKLSGPTRKYPSLNLFQIDALSQTNDIIIIPGKILSQGDLTKKIKLSALSISSLALEKIKKSKSEFIPLVDEIKKNPKAEGVKILP